MGRGSASIHVEMDGAFKRASLIYRTEDEHRAAPKALSLSLHSRSPVQTLRESPR